MTGNIPEPTRMSPKSVLFHDPLNNVADQLILEIPRLAKGPNAEGSLVSADEGQMVRAHKRIRDKDNSSWTICAASKKAKRTDNPIRPSIEQVARRVRSACQRSDRKSPISLAVSRKLYLIEAIKSASKVSTLLYELICMPFQERRLNNGRKYFTL